MDGCRKNNKSVDAYSIAFKKVFNKCNDFVVGEMLLGVVTNWLDVGINGLKLALGTETAESLLKGCHVHWFMLLPEDT